MKLNAETKTIEELNEHFFVVPDYQREYVWDADKNVAVFLDDIYREFNPNIQNQTNYFIGSVIIVKRPDGLFDVIDGQQRLTTIIIMLCAIRDILSSSDATADEDVSETKRELLNLIKELLYKYSLKQGKKMPRLVLQYEESKDYLLKLMEGKPYIEGDTGSIKRMKDAYKTISNFSTTIYKDNENAFLKFVQYFLGNVQIVTIEPDNIGSALKIFETINERGVGLNAMDLLKNLLFIKAREEDFKEIKEIWKKVVNNLQECGEGDKPLRFLRYFIIARYHDGVITEEDIYEWIVSAEGNTAIKYERNPVEFAKLLAKISKKYSDFVKAGGSWVEDTNYPSVTRLSYLSKNARQPFILLLALNDSFDLAAINLLGKNLEVLMFYYAMNKVLTKYYEDLFAKLAKIIRNIQNLEGLKHFINSDLAEVVQKQREAFSNSFDTRNQFDLQPQYRIKYVLGQAEDYIRKNTHLPCNNIDFYQQLHLEHILPQEGKNIPAELKTNYNNWVYRIGNLTLLEGPINQSLNTANDLSSDVWFLTKTKAYQNSNIELTKTFNANKIGADTAYNRFVVEKLKHFDTWNAEKIQERQEMLKQLFLEVWKIDTI
jgi:hypothetical protein